MRNNFSVDVQIVHSGIDGKIDELALGLFEAALKTLEFRIGGLSLFVSNVDPCPCPMGIKGSLADQAEHLAAAEASVRPSHDQDQPGEK